MYKKLIFYEYYNNYLYSVILINLFIYIFILINLFLIFLMYDLQKLKSLSDFKSYSNYNFIFISIILILLSFAGVPPLFGFISKFLIFVSLISKNYHIMLCFFLFINIFIIYFYIQNFRFLVSSKNTNIFIFKKFKFYLNDKMLLGVNIFNFFNIFSLFYFEEFLFFFNYATSYLNF